MSLTSEASISPAGSLPLGNAGLPFPGCARLCDLPSQRCVAVCYHTALRVCCPG